MTLEASRLALAGPGGQPVFSGISFSLEKGQALLLTGPSGSGKSALLQTICGLIPAVRAGQVSGRLVLDGQDLAGQGPGERGRKMALVFQDCRSQFFLSHSDEELLFTALNYGLEPAEIERRFRLAVRDLSVCHLLGRNILGLSSGERQRLAIAAAAVYAPEVMLFDDPAANLDAAGQAGLIRLIRSLKAEGRTVLAAGSSRSWPDSLFEQTLELGPGPAGLNLEENQDFPAGSGEPEPKGRPAGVCVPAGRGPDRSGRSQVRSGRGFPAEAGRPVLELRALSAKRAGRLVLEDIEASFEAGQVAALVGDNGAGKTTLLKIICGLMRPHRGKILLRGRPASGRRRLARCAAVLQDPDFQLFAADVRSELFLGRKSGPESQASEELIAAFRLPGLLDRHPGSLAKGEKQRVLLAAALSRVRDIYLFDEPTSGLDSWMAAEFIRRIRLRAEEGHLAIIISHDEALVRAAADKVFRIQSRHLAEEAWPPVY
ncbi:MAG: ATP-binding cassette domain-containing protein [Deltaproteobacteria bacterium]|jgi:energy-coupling factor transport system ATP-binding protein|nr:ATP-binding cassette domain-containing protein [Deltaproteobacteria bacterium]